MPIPVASTHRSPRRLTSRPASGAEANRTSANTETTAPAAKLLTPNSRANSGIEGATTPKPRATEKATAVRTATSGGSEAKGLRRARIRPPTLADRDDRRDNRPRHRAGSDLAVATTASGPTDPGVGVTVTVSEKSPAPNP